jgi:hypothetical protein
MDDSFPAELRDCPPEQVITQKFGWQYANWGAYLIVASVWLFNQTDQGVIYLALAGFALAAFLLGKEWQRRLNPMAICLRGPRLGLYRRQKFAVEFTRPQITLFTTSYFNTFRFVILFSVGIFLGALPLIPRNPDPEYPLTPAQMTTLADKIAGLALSLTCGSSIISIIYTRHVYTIFWLPRKKWFRPTFLASRADGARLLNSQ